jgi:hypothetical protein
VQIPVPTNLDIPAGDPGRWGDNPKNLLAGAPLGLSAHSCHRKRDTPLDVPDLHLHHVYLPPAASVRASASELIRWRGRRCGVRPASHHWGQGKNPNFEVKRYGSDQEPVVVVAVHVPLPNSPGRTVHGMNRDRKVAERAAAAAACDVLDDAGLLRRGGRVVGMPATSSGEEWVLPSARLAVDMHLLSQCELAAHELLEEPRQLSTLPLDDSRSRASPLSLSPVSSVACRSMVRHDPRMATRPSCRTSIRPRSLTAIPSMMRECESEKQRARVAPPDGNLSVMGTLVSFARVVKNQSLVYAVLYTLNRLHQTSGTCLRQLNFSGLGRCRLPVATEGGPHAG